jgi:hypothetical protein
MKVVLLIIMITLSASLIYAQSDDIMSELSKAPVIMPSHPLYKFKITVYEPLLVKIFGTDKEVDLIMVRLREAYAAQQLKDYESYTTALDLASNAIERVTARMKSKNSTIEKLEDAQFLQIKEAKIQRAFEVLEQNKEDLPADAKKGLMTAITHLRISQKDVNEIVTELLTRVPVEVKADIGQRASLRAYE